MTNSEPASMRALCFHSYGEWADVQGSRQAKDVAVDVDYDINEIGIVERHGRSLECRLIEIPAGRPFLPEQPAQFAFGCCYGRRDPSRSHPKGRRIYQRRDGFSQISKKPKSLFRIKVRREGGCV